MPLGILYDTIPSAMGNKYILIKIYKYSQKINAQIIILRELKVYFPIAKLNF